jgi:hypothetical protein
MDDKQGDPGGRPYLDGKQGDRQGGPYTLDDLYFFLALLNSRLLRQYVYTLHTAYKWVQPQIEQSVLARLPIPIVEQNVREDIICRVKALSSACSENSPVVEWNGTFTTMYEELEHAICALYDSIM